MPKEIISWSGGEQGEGYTEVLFKTLLSLLMTGKMRVKDLEM